jgi:protein involved in polysaccharide export with SLBB domain
MKKIMVTMSTAVCWVCMLFMFSGCASAPQVYPATQPPAQMTLAPGDQIEIKFAHSQEFNETQTIRPDGKIEMQFVGEVAAAGKTPAELREELKQLFGQHLKYPQLAVFVRTWNENRVYVGGEVTRPGVVAMPGRLTALEAIMEAGGFKLETAGTSNIVVLRQRDGKYQGQALDLKQALAGNSAAAFFLEPRDIVFVPQSTVVRVDQWIEQYINKITPNIGFNLQRTSPSGRTNWGYDTGNN